MLTTVPTSPAAHVHRCRVVNDGVRRGVRGALTVTLVGLAVGLGAGQAHAAPLNTAAHVAGAGHGAAARVTALYPVVPADSSGGPTVACGPGNAGQVVVTSDAYGGVRYHRCTFEDDVRTKTCSWVWEEIVRPD